MYKYIQRLFLLGGGCRVGGGCGGVWWGGAGPVSQVRSLGRSGVSGISRFVFRGGFLYTGGPDQVDHTDPSPSPPPPPRRPNHRRRRGSLKDVPLKKYR